MLQWRLQSRRRMLPDVPVRLHLQRHRPFQRGVHLQWWLGCHLQPYRWVPDGGGLRA